MIIPQLSVVIPLYNEEAALPALFARLYRALDSLKRTYEIIFVNDGSRDRSAALLADQHAQRQDVTRVILFNGNFGQHRAILAGFEHARGQCVLTLDADLQNPPEEIGKFLEKMDQGYDYVGSIRDERKDRLWRHVASRLMNQFRKRITHIEMTDQGSMMRAYSRRIVDTINQCREMNTFVPALGYSFAQSPTEIVIKHEQRVAGETKYPLYRLIRLNFDLMTGFSIVPLQLFSMGGMIISVLSGLLVLVMFLRRMIIGPEEGGLFTLFGVAFLLIGIALFGIGLLGEYIGRIYQEVRHRPRYVIAAILENHPNDG